MFAFPTDSSSSTLYHHQLPNPFHNNANNQPKIILKCGGSGISTLVANFNTFSFTKVSKLCLYNECSVMMFTFAVMNSSEWWKFSKCLLMLIRYEQSLKHLGRWEMWRKNVKTDDIERCSRLIDKFLKRDIQSLLIIVQHIIIIDNGWNYSFNSSRSASIMSHIHILHKLELIDVKFPGWLWVEHVECKRNENGWWKWLMQFSLLSTDCIWQWTNIIENMVRYFKSELDRAKWFSSRQVNSYEECSNMKENIQNIFCHQVGFISIRSIKLNVVYYSCEYCSHFNIIPHHIRE